MSRRAARSTQSVPNSSFGEARAQAAPDKKAHRIDNAIDALLRADVMLHAIDPGDFAAHVRADTVDFEDWHATFALAEEMVIRMRRLTSLAVIPPAEMAG